jgi:hypothetical protein
MGTWETNAKHEERHTPRWGDISLNWFDTLFYRPEGPGTWAKGALVRYADDFVILAKYLDFSHSKMV